MHEYDCAVARRERERDTPKEGRQDGAAAVTLLLQSSISDYAAARTSQYSTRASDSTVWFVSPERRFRLGSSSSSPTVLGNLDLCFPGRIFFSHVRTISRPQRQLVGRRLPRQDRRFQVQTLAEVIFFAISSLLTSCINLTIKFICDFISILV